MKKGFFTKTAVVLLCAATILGLLPLSAGAAFRNEKAEKTAFVSRLTFDIPDEKTVRAVVVYEGDSGSVLLRKGKAQSLQSANAKALGNSAALDKKVRASGGEFVFHYGALLKGAAVDAKYADLKRIERLDGVKAVYLANSYKAPVIGDAPKMSYVVPTCGTIEGGGRGAVIAVADVGFNVTHEAFSTNGVEEKLTKAGMEAIRDGARGTNGKGVYVSAKIPFAYDYADNDTEVSSAESHGTAVAGIAAGNNGADYKGTAPNAQLLCMKVFNDADGLTDSAIYFAALEDACLLGADAINMSLGTPNGFSYDPELEDEVFGNIYETLRGEGVFVLGAAGNEYSQGYSGFACNWLSTMQNIDAVTADYADYGVVGSPATYRDVVAVASFDNTRYYACTVTVGGEHIEYCDSAVDAADSFFACLGGKTFQYEMIPGVGKPEDYQGIDVSGKIAVVMRGDTTFQEKLSCAAEKGAAGLIVVNNEEGVIAMQIEDFAIPAVIVQKPALEVFRNCADKRLTVEAEMVEIGDQSNLKPSDFSSWGCTPDLRLKPEISGIGGNVQCPDSSDNSAYQCIGGTSMATPVVTGYFAALKAHFAALNAEPYKSFTKRQMYDFVYGELLSYANRFSGVSPRKQGAGLVDCRHLGKAYFENPIVNLGDDKDKTGVYSFEVPAKSVEAGVLLSLKDAEVLCDCCVDLGEEGSPMLYNLMSAQQLTAKIETDSDCYELSQTPVNIKVTIRLTDESKEYLDAYPYGGFVEGYIDFAMSGEENAPHLTFMGFYGDWCEAPAFETYDWGDLVEIEYELNTEICEETGQTYAESGYTRSDFLEMNVGYNEGYLADAEGKELGYFGDNPFVYAPFDAKHLAFSTAAAECGHQAESFLIYPALLRNLRHLIMTVTDAKTGDVYYVDDTEYAMKDYFSSEKASFDHGTYFTWDGSYEDEHGEKHFVPNDTEVKVTFQTQIDFEGAPLVTEREFAVFVDYEAPDVSYDWNAETKELTVSAKDNQYLSYISVCTNEGGEELAGEAVEAEAKNEEYRNVYDLSDCDFGGSEVFYLEVRDYATNYVSFEIPVPCLKGDVNRDGTVDNLDAALVLRHDAGLTTFEAETLDIADVNGDGTVDNMDAAMILRYDAGIIDKF